MNHPLYLFHELRDETYAKMYNDFFYPSETLRLYYEKLEIDFNNKTKEIAFFTEDKLSGEQYLNTQNVSFLDILGTHLGKCVEESIKNIDNNLLFILDSESQKKFLDRIVVGVFKLIEEFKEVIEDISIYHDTKMSLIFVSEYLLKTYTDYIPNTNLLRLIEKSKLQSEKEIFGFLMLPEYLNRITPLFDMLVENKFISDKTSIDDFIKAFNGERLNPFFKIEWTAKVKSANSSKPLLLYFISKLMENKIIQSATHSTLIKTTQLVFSNNSGKEFSNLSISSSQSRKNKTVSPQQKIVDTIIEDFLKLVE